MNKTSIIVLVAIALVLPSAGMSGVAYPRESGGGEIERNNETGQSIRVSYSDSYNLKS